MNDPLVTRSVDSRPARQYAGILVASALWIVSPANARTPQEIFETNAPSIVIVEVHDSNGKLEATGSGVTIAAGEIITNCHVAEDGKTLLVRQSTTKYPARLHYADRDHDLCQLTVSNFKAAPVTIADVTNLRTGAHVVAIGAPEGLELSVSEGLIASLRDLDSKTRIIQTTAPISPGSSGGGLFDDQGRLIGITSFYLAEGQNLNFALPANWIADLPQHQLEQSKRQRATQEWARGERELILKIDFNDPKAKIAANKAVLAYDERWTQAEPQSPDAWRRLGRIQLVAHQYTQSMDSCRTSLRLSQSKANSDAWDCLGDAYFYQKQYSKALDAYREAQKINPLEPFYYLDLGKVYSELGKFDQEIDVYREWQQADPKSKWASATLGLAYRRAGRYDQAINIYREALKIDPKDTSAWNSLGATYVVLKQYDRALVAYQEDIRLDKEDSFALAGLAHVYIRLKKYDLAIELCHKELQGHPRFADMWYYMGLAYGKKGDRDGAVKAYQTLRSLNVEKADELFNLVIAPR